MGNPSWEIAMASLPALLTAGFTALGFWLSERRKDKDALQQRLKTISEESARVRYLRSWLKTCEMVVTSDPSVRDARIGVGADLVASHTRLEHALQTPRIQEQVSTGSRAVKRALLFPLERPMARAVRWGYWLFLTLAVLFTSAFMTSGYTTSDGTPPTPLNVLASAFIMFAFFFAIAMVFRGWATWLEHRHARLRAGFAPGPWSGASQSAPIYPMPYPRPGYRGSAPGRDNRRHDEPPAANTF